MIINLTNSLALEESVRGRALKPIVRGYLCNFISKCIIFINDKMEIIHQLLHVKVCSYICMMNTLRVVEL